MHERFDLSAWITETGFRIDENAGPGTIDTPRELATFVLARERWLKQLEPVDPLECDVALYAFGEPEHGAVSTTGGRPWLPQDVGWPVGNEDVPMVFLGQVYLGDSLELLPAEPPGVLVLIFGELVLDGISRYSEYFEESQRRLVWLDAEQVRRGAWRGPPDGYLEAAPAHGVLFRTMDVRRWKPRREDVEFEDGQTAYDVERVGGTKIGGHPNWIQRFDEEVDPTDRLICSLGSMYYHSNGSQYVYVNQPHYDRTAVSEAGGEFCLGDMGLINVIRRGDESIYTTFESS